MTGLEGGIKQIYVRRVSTRAGGLFQNNGIVFFFHIKTFMYTAYATNAVLLNANVALLLLLV